MKKVTVKQAGKMALASAALLGSAAAAHAIPVNFVVADVPATSVGISITGDTASVANPMVTYASGLAGTAFSLDLDGGPTSHTFDFFKLWVSGGSGADYGSGYIQADVSATLAFDDPGGDTSGTAGVGVSYYTAVDSCSWWGSCDYDTYLGNGSLIWDPQPANVLLGDGTEFSVTLSDIASVRSGWNNVTATVELISGPEPRTSVPEPASLALLSVGFLGMGLRRLRAASKV